MRLFLLDIELFHDRYNPCVTSLRSSPQTMAAYHVLEKVPGCRVFLSQGAIFLKGCLTW